MNKDYFEYYGQYMTAPFIITIVGASLLLFAIITLVLAICLFGKKNRGLYAVSKTTSIITLVASILLTVVYAAIIGLVATSPELFVYQGDGIIGTIRDLTCGIFLAPHKFGIQIDTENLNTRLPFIFYTLTVFVPAAIGFIAVIVSSIAQRSSRRARNSIFAQLMAPANSTPVNMNQPVQNPVPAPAPIPAPVPVAEPVQTVQDNSPIDEAPIQKLVPETVETPEATAEVVPETAETPEATAEAVPEVSETPEATAEAVPEVAETPEATAEAVPEVAETPEATAEAVPEVVETPEATAEAVPEVVETPEATAEAVPVVVETPEATAEVVPVVVETPEATAEAVPVVVETPAEEKPIDENKILNLVATPPAENTVTNDKPLFCMNCGTPLGGGAFCINCGTPAKPQSRTCKGCNAVLADDSRFCMICGTKVE
ncbi:MAG: hypothetical protein IJZ51_09605 [Ruminiclostridium sp.]|nr:hypothetical protein [Ruminiclostridium sp.]